MDKYLKQHFDALVYSNNRTVAVRCTQTFATLPIDWIMLEDSRLASNYLRKERFDFVILDVDSPGGSALLDVLSASRSSQSVVLLITSEPIDPAILEMCYKSQFFYPVRPDDVEDQLCRALPLAERLSAQIEHNSPIQVISSEQIDPQDVSEITPVSEPRSPRTFAFGSNLRRLGSALLASLCRVFRMQHSLSVVAHERVASAIASVGSIWLVHEFTRDFRGFGLIGPPSAGPTDMIALSLLLWLCAKHRRASAEHCSLKAVSASAES